MKLIDRVFHINPTDAVPGNRHYDTYRFGLKWSVIGGLAIIGGFILEGITGTELGVSVTLGAGPVTYIGGIAMAAGLNGLKPV